MPATSALPVLYSFRRCPYAIRARKALAVSGQRCELREVVLRDKAEWREKARLQLVEWFALCTDADAVSRGRRYLGMYLN